MAILYGTLNTKERANPIDSPIITPSNSNSKSSDLDTINSNTPTRKINNNIVKL